MVYHLKRIGIWPVAKIAFVVNGLIGLGLGGVYGLMLAIIGGLMDRMGGNIIAENLGLMSGLAGMVFAGFFSVAYASAGAFFAALAAWLYNITAHWIGGMELDLELQQPLPGPSLSLSQDDPSVSSPATEPVLHPDDQAPEPSSTSSTI